MPTLQQTFDLALQHHQSGRLPEAENLYRQILAQQPTHADALHLLGVIAHQSGRHDIAVDLIGRSLALNSRLPEAHANLGVALLATGRLDDAIAAYRRAIALNPNFSQAHNNLGNALVDKRLFDQAIAAFTQAITLTPNYPEAHNNLGVALKNTGRLDNAIDAFGRAIALNPNYAEAHTNLAGLLAEKGQSTAAAASYRASLALNPNQPEAFNNLGVILAGNSQLDEAITAFSRAIALNPNYPDAHNNLGIVLRESGRLDDAIAAYHRAITLRPNYAEAYNNLANALKDKGQLDASIAAYRQAIALNPNLADAHSNLGNALKDAGQLDEAVTACRHAILINPNLAAAHSNLGIALRVSGQLDESIASYRRAIALRPNYAEAHSNLGIALKDAGQLDEAVAAYRQAITLNPNLAEAHSNLVYALHFHPGYTPQAIADEHHRWNRQHAEPLKKFIPIHSAPGKASANDPAQGRPLCIGYVSGDFRNHVVGRNLLPLFRHHDRRQFEITCYSQALTPDAMTVQFQQNADRWRNIVGLSNEQAFNQIRDDQIDILVDLTLHLGNGRLLLFARKPAPVQVTFAGYPGSTGLTTIDYRLSDPYLDPPDANESLCSTPVMQSPTFSPSSGPRRAPSSCTPGEGWGGGLSETRTGTNATPESSDHSLYTEKTIRLPHSFWCYDPLECADIPVTPLPALASGVVTFGCLNNFCKFNDEVLKLWAAVLRQIESSRLILLAPAGAHRQQTLDRFAQEGIDPTRVEFLPVQSRQLYLETYHRIDIGLDTFPYNGHTTSLDSIWMGVPVVTLVGNTPVARAGWCQLSNLGLPELAADTPEQFVRIAVDLADDLPRLEHLRATLRPRMEQSPLMDAQSFTHDIEAAYLQIWQTWAASRP